MKNYIVYILLALFIFSSAFIRTLWKNGYFDDKKINTNQTEKNDQISIDTFSIFPPEIDGCACYFSNDETDFKKSKYIYADDYGNNAFVSINGIMTKFVLSKSEILPDKRSVKTFINDKYEITIDFKQVGQIDETWQQTGKLKIKLKNSREITKNIYGECGC